MSLECELVVAVVRLLKAGYTVEAKQDDNRSRPTFRVRFSWTCSEVPYHFWRIVRDGEELLVALEEVAVERKRTEAVPVTHKEG